MDLTVIHTLSYNIVDFIRIKGFSARPLEFFALFTLLQIAEKVCFVHAIHQHLLEAVLYCCDIFVIGHAIPGIVCFQYFALCA